MFISFEGIEGSGKTTQINHMDKFLRDNGHDCVITREPGGTRIGEEIRAILLNPASKDMDPLTELLLYTADRAQHIREFVYPCLSAGKTVLCDRFYDATVVYQGFARGLDIRLINKLHKLLFEDLKPDITFLLDLPPEKGLSRAWKQIESGTRTSVETRFEEEERSFHNKVRSGYLELARLEPIRFKVIDASVDENHVRNEIKKILYSEINLNT
ncbi:MAG: dTMP kinase [Desulfobacterales bacterium]|jgi:dTMP kinase